MNGRTFAITSEDLVIFGIIFSPAALLSLNPSPATSAKRFEFEYPWTVVRKALSTPTLLSKALRIGATAFAVLEPKENAFEFKFISSSFAPGTYIWISLKSSGVDATITFLQPFDRCFSTSSFVLGLPVARTTISVLSLSHLASSPFFQELNNISLPFTTIPLSESSISASSCP